MRVRWTTLAAKALPATQEHIAIDNPRAAFEVAQHIHVALDQLRDLPKMDREGRVRGTHELVPGASPSNANLPRVETMRKHHDRFLYLWLGDSLGGQET